MNKCKQFLLNAGGFTAYVGLPLIPVIQQWGFLVHTDAKTTVSSGVALCLVMCLPVLKYVVKKDKLPFDVNKVWAVVLIVSAAFMFIAKQMVIISMFGTAGSVIGSAAFKKANKLKEAATKQSDNAKLSEAIAEAIKEKG